MVKRIGMFACLFLVAVTLTACSENKEDKKDSNKSENKKENVEKKNEKKKASPEVSDVKTSKEDCMNGCFVMWKANKGNAERTEADMNKDCNALCDAGQGIQNQDLDSCAKSDGILRDTCYTDIAEKNDNPEICEKITDKTFISGCYTKIAEKRKDASLCEKVPVPMMKSVCLDSAK